MQDGSPGGLRPREVAGSFRQLEIMKRRLGVRLRGPTDARAAITNEADGLDRELAFDAELSVTEIATEAQVFGAFQRRAGATAGAILARRVSGGGLVQVSAGTLHVALVLASSSSLVACTPRTILNRYVRPLLRALTKGGAPASYFGRDWISVGHRPAASVGFAHDVGTGRTVFEAFVALRRPFSEPRASFLGKPPGSLESICGRAFDAGHLARAIVDAYLAAGDRDPHELSSHTAAASLLDDDVAAEPPWVACIEEAIGPVCAGRDRRGVLRLGGDLLASRDAIAELEAKIAVLGHDAGPDELGRAVQEALGAPGVALEGVRDLGSVREAITRALAAEV
jgi:hypothetical protein